MLRKGGPTRQVFVNRPRDETVLKHPIQRFEMQLGSIDKKGFQNQKELGKGIYLYICTCKKHSVTYRKCACSL